jgi:hypothetical protein
VFDIDRQSTSSGYPEFEKTLQEHLKVELGRDPLVVFMLILLLRHFAKAFSFEVVAGVWAKKKLFADYWNAERITPPSLPWLLAL